MTNLKESTISALLKHGKSINDVKWIGCRFFKIPIDKFWEMSDREFNAGYGSAEVAEDLLVVGDTWWLERGEYDGSEWWQYKEKPEEPKSVFVPPTLFPTRDTDYKVMYLSEYVL